MHSKRALSRTLCLLTSFPVWAGQPCGGGPQSASDLDYLNRCRPALVSSAEKMALLATLPPEGEVKALTRAQRAKLEGVASVLRVFGRDQVWDIKCIDVPQAWAGLFERSVLLISVAALNTLSTAELQALAAHEAGHEYLLGEWASARDAADAVRLRGVEMLCDEIAVLGLIQLGRRPND